MNRATLTNFFFYKYRYGISYTVMSLLLVSLLYIAGILIPGGISQSEMTSSVTSGALTVGSLIGNQPELIAHLPYRFLQFASIEVLGLSALSIKLPSLVVAALAVGLFYKVLTLWFRTNVAIISTVILMTSTLFLLQAQLGSPGIMYFFWGSLLLLTTSMMAHGNRFSSLWLVLSSIIAGLALYSPFFVYAIIPLLVAAGFHPHARFVILRQPLWSTVLAGLFFALIITPLILSSIHDPSILLRLVAGSDITDGTFSAFGNLVQLSQYADFLNTHSGRILQPAYGLGLVLIAAVGLVHLISQKYTAKSYIMTVWLFFTIPILYLNPDAASVSLLPIMLLVAFGIDMLIRYWYRMFPLNPYARIAGLFPLAVLVVGLSLSSLDRFVYGYRYNSDAAAAYSNDLRLIDDEISQLSNEKIELIVPKDEVSFYQLYAKTNGVNSVTVGSDMQNATETRNDAIILADQSQVSSELIPTRVITSDTLESANRLYLYENTPR